MPANQLPNFRIKTGRPAQDILARRYHDAESAIRNAQRQVREREIDHAYVLNTEKSYEGEVIYIISRNVEGEIYDADYRK